ncbi:pseudouridylate synthase TRUB2, mitochondrial [Lycorma delicatula]|uniref:pseudouridylate synthase TRUB2, mitochondrial n=1 Tax=Lycorma delicatula TaxID=130591 RepID=UPI003F50F4D0
MSVLVQDAPSVWNSLRGLICIYKPAGISCFSIRKTLTGKITSELCEMNCRPPEKRVFIEGDDTTKKLTVRIDTNYADHPLVVGPRYQPRDFKCVWVNYLGKNTSGVQLYGIKDGTKVAHKLNKLYPLRTYRIKGQLGFSTDTFFTDGKVIEKAKFNRINRPMIDRWCAAMQASHQTKMFEMCGVDLQSQAAYELAVKGPLRPSQSDIPVIYSVKCVEFKSPDFTIEVQCINENELYLMTLIHQLGYKLHSSATCTQIQCIRYTVFTVEDALLRKHWTLQNIIDNLSKCNKTVEKYKDLLDSPHLVNVNVNDDSNSNELNVVNR